MVLMHQFFHHFRFQYLWWYSLQVNIDFQVISIWQYTLNIDNFQASKAWNIDYFKCGLYFVYALVVCPFLILVVNYPFLVNVTV